MRAQGVTAAAVMGLVMAAGPAWAGPLTPSGPVAPTMKTLTEVEPRVAVSDVNTPGTAQSLYRITQPGSYYLTGNITASGKNAIEIVASNVTLDLNGFTLSGTGPVAGVTAGVLIDSVVVKNGNLENFSGGGIQLATVNLVPLKNVRVENVRALNCLVGVSVGDSSVVAECRTTGCSAGVSAGLGSLITHCVTTGASNSGIRLTGDGVIEQSVSNGCVIGYQLSGDSVVRDSMATNCTSTGISLQLGAMAERCQVIENASGIVTGANCRVIGCMVVRNSGDGISVTTGCMVEGNTSRENGAAVADGAGITTRTGTSGCRIANNTVALNDRGIRVLGTNNFVVGNTAISNPTNYLIDAGNRVGLIVVPPPSVAISGNSGGGTGATDPMMNLSN